MSARGPNLSELALKNSTLTAFFMIVLTAAGVFAYFNLGRGEDPPFTIKQMVVSAAWPGATSREMELQVTDKLETKLQELPYFYNVQSYTKPGETVIYVSLRDDVPPARCPSSGTRCARRSATSGTACRKGVLGPNFNDEYGDTYSLIWAFEADGFSDAEVKAMVKEARLRLLRVPDVTKADLFGVQDEKIYIEFSHARLAMMACRSTRSSTSCASRTPSPRRARSRPRASAWRSGSTARPPRPSSSWRCRSAPPAAPSPWATSPRSSAATPIRASSRCASTASR
jgi:multidrug efflux pump subunit AcrB